MIDCDKFQWMVLKPVRVQDLKNSQYFVAVDKHGGFHEFKCCGDPMVVKGKWTIDCTCSGGDYCYTFTEDDDSILFVEK